ncbi:hypothetical protein [Nonomuraea dietziae]|uniref:hypothetical protein n=1 Tax=Nonomuraea dietziae TaxID=65515 RepID=UPI0031D4B0F2
MTAATWSVIRSTVSSVPSSVVCPLPLKLGRTTVLVALKWCTTLPKTLSASPPVPWTSTRAGPLAFGLVVDVGVADWEERHGRSPLVRSFLVR